MRLKNGATLVELVTVLIVVSILALVLIPRLSGLEDMRAVNAITHIKSDIRYVQRLAQVEHLRFGIMFDAGHNRYDVFAGDDTTDLIADPSHLEDFQIYLNQGALAGVTLTDAQFDGSAIIKFDEAGTPLRGDTNEPIAAVGTVTISSGGQSRSVYIDPVTGRVYE